MTVKNEFILDENVVICSQTGLDDRGEVDPTYTDLVSRIIRICHTIVVDLELYGRYRRQLGRNENQETPLGIAMLPVLHSAIQTAGKFNGFDRISAQPFPEESLIPQGSQDDVPVTVRLAVETGAILVTTDEPLRRDIDSTGIQQTYALTVVPPEEALRLL